MVENSRCRAQVGPFALLHVLDIYKVRLNLESVVRNDLQKAILRRYLHYTEESRRDLGLAHVEVVLTTNVDALIENGVMTTLGLMDAISRIVIISVWMTSRNAFAIYPVLCFPTFNYLWTYHLQHRVSLKPRGNVPALKASRLRSKF